MWRLKTKIIRQRPVVLVGAAATSVLFGVAILNKLLTPAVKGRCLASCATVSAYQILQRNEASQRIKQHRVKGYDVNFLGSNSPIEDRFVTGASNNLGAALFSVIDGHKGTHCSHYLQHHMLQHISSSLHKLSNTEDDIRIMMDMSRPTNSAPSDVAISPKSSLEPRVLAQSLQESLLALDKSFCDRALKDIELVKKGHSLTPDMRERVLTAIEGACAITALVQSESVLVASTGDCRAVMGHQMPNKQWKPVPLSVDQNSFNPAEVSRLQKAHPGEEVIIENRVLGSLMPFRSFGDADFKWDKKYLEGIVNVWPNYRSPPYITAEPVLTTRRLERGDRFMIIASDGLWERITNEEAVNIVADAIGLGSGSRKASFFQSILGRPASPSEECCGSNAATRLMWHVLGGSEQNVTKLLNIEHPQLRRIARDDLTIMVVYFND